MIKLQFKLPQALISRGFTRRTVFHAPAFQKNGINRLIDIYASIKLTRANVKDQNPHTQKRQIDVKRGNMSMDGSPKPNHQVKQNFTA